MDIAHLTRLCRGFSDPSRSVAHVRGKFENFGDILVADAIAAMFPGLCLVDCGLSPRLRWLDSLVGIQRFYRYSCLGGGTLIHNSQMLATLQFICPRTIPLFTIGTGVIDPEFLRTLYGPGSVDETCIKGWIECLESFRFVSVRGVESQRTLAAHGFRGATVIGDPALYFARDTISLKRGTKSIGVNVSNYSHFWGHRQEQTVRILSDLISWLKSEGWAVTLFPSMPEDHTLSLGILNALDSDRVRIFGNYSDRESLPRRARGPGSVRRRQAPHGHCGLLCLHARDHDRLSAEVPRLHADDGSGGVSYPIGSTGSRPSDRHDPDDVRRPRIDPTRQFESTQSLRGRLIDFRDQVLESVGMLPSSAATPPRDRTPQRGESASDGERAQGEDLGDVPGRPDFAPKAPGRVRLSEVGGSRSLSPDWDSRTERIARLIPPGATVLEFGAGRMALRN